MLTTKLKLGALLLLLFGFATTVAGLATRHESAAKQPDKKAEASAAQRPAEEKQIHKDRYGDPLPQRAVARLGTVRLRHESTVNCVVFSRGGKTAFAGDSRGNIVFWDVAAGREVRRIDCLDHGTPPSEQE